MKIELLRESIESLDNIRSSEVFVRRGEKFVHIADVYPDSYEAILASIRKRHRADVNFVMVFQENEKEAIRSLSPAQFRVISYLRSVMTYENRVTNVTAEDIAVGTNATTRTVYTALAELEKAGFLIKEGTKINRSYIINPTLAWRGNVRNQAKTLSLFEK